MSNEYDVQAFLADPVIKNNQQHQARVAADTKLYSGIPGLDMAKTYAERQAAINNYYDEQTAAERKKANIASDFATTDYQSTIDALNKNLAEEAATLADTEGQKGTFGSSARADRMASLAGKYNTSYKDAYNKAVAAAEQAGVNTQQNLGLNFESPTFQQYGITPTGGTTVGQAYKYNPFAQKSGLIEANRAYSLSNIKAGK